MMYIQRYKLKIQPPDLKDNTADIDRLKREIARVYNRHNLKVRVKDIAGFSKALRAGSWSVTVDIVESDNGLYIYQIIPGLNPETSIPVKPDENFFEQMSELPDVDQQNTIGLGLAIDVGTTTLVMSLVNLPEGQVLDSESLTNPQVELGADILSRIHNSKGKGLAKLQNLVISGINKGINELCNRSDIKPESITSVCGAGNTTMIHLFLGLDPFTICREPYIPIINKPDPFPAKDIGLKVAENAPVYLFPNIGSYFGGDIIAGLLSSGMTRSNEISLFVDVGTNAEVVVGNRDFLMGCAGAAGPALEGGVARMGMSASSGAIEKVMIDRKTLEPVIEVIGNQEPVGLCGSGLIDLVAELYLSGVIDMQAKIKPYDHPRIVITEDGPAYLLAENNSTGKQILFSQLDLDVLLRSKAAMYTILTTLLKQVGLSFSDLSRIYVAGTFGQHINPRKAVDIGMMPDLPIEKYTPLGNSSLDGAILALQSHKARQEASNIRDQITYLELNVNQEFMNSFSAAKFMPHTDIRLFPSVKTPAERHENILPLHNQKD